MEMPGTPYDASKEMTKPHEPVDKTKDPDEEDEPPKTNKRKRAEKTTKDLDEEDDDDEVVEATPKRKKRKAKKTEKDLFDMGEAMGTIKGFLEKALEHGKKDNGQMVAKMAHITKKLVAERTTVSKQKGELDAIKKKYDEVNKKYDALNNKWTTMQQLFKAD